MFFDNEEKPHRAGESTAGPTKDHGIQHSISEKQNYQDEIELPGILGQISQYIYYQSPYPSKSISNAGVIGLLSGICGRSYNVSGAGLNQYMLVLANTGMGKEAIASGTSKLMAEVQKSCPAAAGFRGPGQCAWAGYGVCRLLKASNNPVGFLLGKMLYPFRPFFQNGLAFGL